MPRSPVAATVAPDGADHIARVAAAHRHIRGQAGFVGEALGGVQPAGGNGTKTGGHTIGTLGEPGQAESARLEVIRIMVLVGADQGELVGPAGKIRQ